MGVPFLQYPPTVIEIQSLFSDMEMSSPRVPLPLPWEGWGPQTLLLFIARGLSLRFTAVLHGDHTPSAILRYLRTIGKQSLIPNEIRQLYNRTPWNWMQ
jgi:hypothetical protein